MLADVVQSALTVVMVAIMVFALWCIVWGLICAGVSRRRGGSWQLGALVGVFGPFGLAVVLYQTRGGAPLSSETIATRAPTNVGPVDRIVERLGLNEQEVDASMPVYENEDDLR
jgi:hypothetical protein